MPEEAAAASVERDHRRVVGCLGAGAGCALFVFVAPAPTREIGIAGLPPGIVDGDCLTLRQFLDGNLEYVKLTPCP